VKFWAIYHPKPYLVEPAAQYGLGLLSLATLARELGYEVRVVDAQAGGPVVAGAGVVAFSGCLIDGPIIAAAAAKLRATYGRAAFLVAGGPVSRSPELLGDTIDLIVQGPGETVLAALSTANRPRGRIVVPERQPFNRWPPPDRSMLRQPGGRIFHPRTGLAGPSATLLTSRGCRYRCAFCQSGSCNAFHEYPLDRIDAELRQIVGLGIRHVRVADDNVLRRPDRARAVFDLLGRYGVRWRGSLRCRPNDPSLYRAMADSGCVELNFGVESADPDVLRAIRKGQTVEDGERAVDNAAEAGIPSVRALMMMGTPGETRRTLGLNQAWCRRHPHVIVCLTSFYPFPGTAIADDPTAFGVRLEPSPDPNFYAFRPDDGEPSAHVSIVGGLSRAELTANLRTFRRFLIDRQQHNPG